MQHPYESIAWQLQAIKQLPVAIDISHHKFNGLPLHSYHFALLLLLSLCFQLIVVATHWMLAQYHPPEKNYYIIIITFTSLALEGVHKRLSLSKVLTHSQGEPINNGLSSKWNGSKKKSNSKAQPSTHSLYICQQSQQNQQKCSKCLSQQGQEYLPSQRGSTRNYSPGQESKQIYSKSNV